MSRLYYEKSKTAAALASGTGGSKLAEYGEKVSKLVPSEIVAGYLTLIGMAVVLPRFQWPTQIGIFGLCLVLTPFYVKKVAEPGKPYKKHMAVSFFAFIVWAYSVSGHAIVPDYYHLAAASIALVVFTLVSGLITFDK